VLDEEADIEALLKAHLDQDNQTALREVYQQAVARNMDSDVVVQAKVRGPPHLTAACQ
jgi:hypothetical protein